MLVHLRLVVPDRLSKEIRDLLLGDDRVTNLVYLPGVALSPPGDLIEVDVAREAADDVLDALDHLGLTEVGGIDVTEIDGTPFAAAARIEKAAGGESDDGVMWDVVAAQAESSSKASYSYYVFLALATALAAVAVLTDSPIIVIGAMVVGPDFGPVAATCTGLALGRWRLAGRSLWLLAHGYIVAVAVVTVLAFVGRLTGVVTAEMVTAPRPLTDFIWHPDLWSFIVALLAGSAGALAMTASKSAALVGVFISVTTVPAAGGLALGLALGIGSEITGSVAQLGINVLGMLLAGTATLLLQRVLLTDAQRTRIQARLEAARAIG